MKTDGMVLNRVITGGNYFLLAIMLLLTFLYCYGIIDVLIRSESYRFGTEVAGWRYYSRSHYLGSLVAELAVCSLGIVVGRFFKKPLYLLLLRLSLVTVLIFWSYLIPM